MPELKSAVDSTSNISRCFIDHQHDVFNLYYAYCKNKPLNEAIRREHVDGCRLFAVCFEYLSDRCTIRVEDFLHDCQKRAGHPLPLNAYLLKPVQRITKYQLLLKELRRHSAIEHERREVERALNAMLELLAQINSAMHQLHISGFAVIDVPLFYLLSIDSIVESRFINI